MLKDPCRLLLKVPRTSTPFMQGSFLLIRPVAYHPPRARYLRSLVPADLALLISWEYLNS